MDTKKVNYADRNFIDGTQENWKGTNISGDQIGKPLTIVNGQEVGDGKAIANTKLAGVLVSYSRLNTGEYFELREGNNFIGQGPNNTIRLLEKHVSQEHALIRVSLDPASNKWLIELGDKGGTNGTYKGDQRLSLYQSVELNNGDRIKIGKYILRVEVFDIPSDQDKSEDFLAVTLPPIYSNPYNNDTQSKGVTMT